MLHRRLLILAWICLGSGFCGQPSAILLAEETTLPNASSAATAEQLEDFEKHIRPVLVEHCQSCHGAEAQKGSFRVDSRASLLKGGDTGPAIVPGEPEASELILAIRYDPDGYQMPPKGKLTEAQIEALTNWVAQGAPWPAEANVPSTTSEQAEFYVKDHWSLQPIQRPRLPEVKDPEWTTSPLDRFILARLEAAGLTPSAEADRNTLVRRAYFDLTGLPPTPAQREAFLQDQRPDAYENLIEELLASPHYGERWGRHWLDLVRFSETLGHEFDYEIPFAWRYRDYVVRALNQDLPWDQFTREHLAGDLLAEPRRRPHNGENESILATGFFWFGQGKHSPVDVRAEQCDLIENQIDVLTKTFLGTSVACARCHDHKFDPVSIEDYYALSGIMESSRQHIADLRPQAPLEETQQKIRQLKSDFRSRILELTRQQLRQAIEDWNAAGFLWNEDEKELQKLEHPGYVLAQLKAISDPAAFVARKQQLIQQLRERQQQTQRQAEQARVLGDFAQGLPSGWSKTETAFESVPAAGDFRCSSDPWRPVEAFVPGLTMDSGVTGGRNYGVLRSPTFEITAPFIDYHFSRTNGERLVADFPRGPLKNGHAHLIIDGFHHIRAPIYGGLSFAIPLAEQPVWHRQHVEKWIGHRAYIEIYDCETGSVQVDQIRQSHQEHPAQPVDAQWLTWLEQNQAQTGEQFLEDFHTYLQTRVADLPLIGQSETSGFVLTTFQARLLNQLLKQSQQQTSQAATPPDWLDQFYLHLKSLEAELGTPQLGLTTIEGTGINSPLLVRGNPGKPSAEVPRRFLKVLDGTAEEIPLHSSGRKELADQLLQEDNPLFDRVVVNRVWKHHFGQGLVTSPDDFGKMGQLPSHPELLDYLASEFRRHDRSLKWLHQFLMTSSTYRMQSDLRPEAEQIDPGNRLWHRMPVRRLEGEAIRDAMLAISGKLQPTLYGESIAPHLTPFMLGRGRPGASGPLDGEGRRSLYLNVRRNFLSPLFLAFDYPLPLTTAGRRSVSNVPAQALTLMNNEFTLQQARLWADRVRAESEGKEGSDTARLQQLYLQAYSRPATTAETAQLQLFLDAERQAGRPEGDIWGDVCHVLWNVKEFVFIR